MIYITGDTHADLDISKVVKFFNKEKINRVLTKKDYLIILGDVGVTWDGGRQDKSVRQILQKLPVTVLFVDGNHENFDLLYKYPVKKWNGGNVHIVEDDILHLMRGQVFNIDGKKFFTFGGGCSADKQYRVEGKTWWRQELPTFDEYKQGMATLEKNNFKVDYIITHTAPQSVLYKKGMHYLKTEEEKLRDYFQRIADMTSFKAWYFGHFHNDFCVDKKYYCVMDKVIRVKG